MMNNYLKEELKEYGYSLEDVSSVIKGDVTCHLILSEDKIPFFIIYEVGNISNYEIGQIADGNQEDGQEFCSLFALADNKCIVTYSKNMKTKQYVQLRDVVYYSHHSRLLSSAGDTINSDKFENIFFEAHSYLRDLDGLHPDEALDELCKIIYAKLYDEESKDDLFSNPQGSNEEYAAVIRKMYKDANEYDIRVFSLKIPGYKRSRGVFDEPISLSANAIYKVGMLFAKYDFSSADIDFKARAFQNVYKPATRAGMGQYFTPIQVIKFIVRCIAPNSSELIIDPFSGSAHFLTEALNYVVPSIKNNKARDEFVFYKLHGIEKSERMVRIAMTDMRLHGDGHSNIRCTDSLLSFESYADLNEGMFDVVMTNPPFGSNLQKDSYEYLGEYELLKDKKKIPLEALGLERSVQLLRKGGRIGIVLPESIFVNKSYTYVRKWIEDNMTIRGIVSLPLSTFAPFGANIKTSILFATKGKSTSNYNIFTGVIENIGFDSKGDEIDGADWEKVADSFREFINLEGWTC